MRYENREIVTNDLLEYQPLFERRKLSRIIHFKSGGLKYPTQEQIDTLNIQSDVWKRGDAFWKYASKFYDGRSELWWVIAFFNNTPTDAHIKIGQTVYIPTPLESVLQAYGV